MKSKKFNLLFKVKFINIALWQTFGCLQSAVQSRKHQSIEKQNNLESKNNYKIENV